MKILVAVDGSEPSYDAVRAVRSLDWGRDTLVRLVDVVPEILDVTGTVVDELVERAIDAEMEGTLSRARELLGPLRDHTQQTVLRGRAADAILEEAEAFGADLIVVGHRGRGPVAARMLGSVASEIAERAGRPVLVVRGDPTEGPVVLADDGSAPARAARLVVATWPLFARRAVRVISVGQVTGPLASGIAITMRREAADARREDTAHELAEHSRIARQAELDLRRVGRDVETTLATGDPAQQVIALARTLQAGLIVVGCRGHNVLTRMLGTTAKAVILGAPCSVMVVHAGAGRTA